MTAFLNFHAFAAARGEGLHPKLRLLFERAATPPASDVAIRTNGLLQSGPDPASETAPGSRERVGLSAILTPAWTSRTRIPKHRPDLLSPRGNDAMRYIIVLLLLMSGMTESHAGKLMERMRLARR